MDFNHKPIEYKPKKQHKSKLVVEFNANALHSYVTGFHQRKLQRQRYGALEHAARERSDKIQLRKQRKQAFIDELGADYSNNVGITDNHNDQHNHILNDDMNSSDMTIPSDNQWKYEDGNAIVTVVTTSNNKDDNISNTGRSKHRRLNAGGGTSTTDTPKLNTMNKPLSNKSKLIQKHDNKKLLKKHIKHKQKSNKSKHSHSTPQRKFHKKINTKKK